MTNPLTTVKEALNSAINRLDALNSVSFTNDEEEGICAEGIEFVRKALTALQEYERESGWQTATNISEIKPCPYINGFTADNTDVSFMARRYEHYLDFVLFDAGKPSRCFRFSTSQPPKEQDDCPTCGEHHSNAPLSCQTGDGE